MPGYMITWTTYGSWLQGDERGYVKNRNVLGKDEGLRKANVERLRSAVEDLTSDSVSISGSCRAESSTCERRITKLISPQVHLGGPCRKAEEGPQAFERAALQRIWVRRYTYALMRLCTQPTGPTPIAPSGRPGGVGAASWSISAHQTFGCFCPMLLAHCARLGRRRL